MEFNYTRIPIQNSEVRRHICGVEFALVCTIVRRMTIINIHINFECNTFGNMYYMFGVQTLVKMFININVYEEINII